MLNFKSEVAKIIFGTFFDLGETLAARRCVFSQNKKFLDNTASSLSAFEFAFRALLAPAIVITLLTSTVNIFLGPQVSYEMYIQKKNASEYVGRQIALLEQLHTQNPSEILARNIEKLRTESIDGHPVIIALSKLEQFKSKLNFLFVILVIVFCSRIFSWSVRKHIPSQADEIYLFGLGANLMVPVIFLFIYSSSLDYAATYEWKNYLNTHYIVGAIMFLWFVVAIVKFSRMVSYHAGDFPRKRRFVIPRVLASIIGGGIAAHMIYLLVLFPFAAIVFAMI